MFHVEHLRKGFYMAKKNRVKNGLDALFGNISSIEETELHSEQNTEKAENQDSIKLLRVALLEPNRKQPRHEFDLGKLNELAENIAAHGVLQPILVRPLDNGNYQIVAGERRWRASRIAGLKEVPVYVRELTDLEVAQIALVENLQREDLNPIEEAEAYKRLSDDFKMTHEDIANSVGKSRSQISNSLRLLKLSDFVKKALADRKISVGHAKVLAALSDKKAQNACAEKAINNDLSVRQLEQEVSECLSTKNDGDASLFVHKKRSPKKKEPYLVEAELALEKEYGRKALLNKDKNGEITMKITFSDLDDFKTMMSKFKM